MTDTNTPTVVVAPVTSAWASKINWTQAVSIVGMMLTFFSGGKIGLTPDQQNAIVLSIGTLGGIATWVFKTYFTTSITKSSVK